MIVKIISLILFIAISTACSSKAAVSSKTAQPTLDFYDRYYLVKMQNLLGIVPSCKIDFEAYIDNPESLFKNNNFDNLSNIYYFVNIMISYGLHDNNFKMQILNYVKSLQTSNGNFAFSKVHKAEVETNNITGGETYLATFLALEIYRLLKTEIDADVERNLFKWINGSLSDSDYWIAEDNIGHFLMVNKILKNQNLKIENYNSKYFSIIDHYFNNAIYNNLSLIELSDYIELSTYSKKNMHLFEELKLHDLIYKFQNEDGGFATTIQEKQSDLLSTYLALNLLVSHNIQIKNSVGLERTIMTYEKNTICKGNN